MEENLIHLDIASEFGAQTKGQRFAIYVPNKNQHGKPVAQGQWVEEGCACWQIFAAAPAPCHRFKVLG